jgi:hypothetical protein
MSAVLVDIKIILCVAEGCGWSGPRAFACGWYSAEPGDRWRLAVAQDSGFGPGQPIGCFDRGRRPGRHLGHRGPLPAS